MNGNLKVPPRLETSREHPLLFKKKCSSLRTSTIRIFGEKGKKKNVSSGYNMGIAGQPIRPKATREANCQETELSAPARLLTHRRRRRFRPPDRAAAAHAPPLDPPRPREPPPRHSLLSRTLPIWRHQGRARRGRRRRSPRNRWSPPRPPTDSSKPLAPSPAPPSSFAPPPLPVSSRWSSARDPAGPRDSGRRLQILAAPAPPLSFMGP